MGTKIQVLSDATINQIAAGEVIENSASVVKELVENALDAGASSIVVEIKAGGQQLIRVSDNGCGMGKEDALLSLERHATSKIRSAEDLFSLSSMGFRGEALASIASISRFTLMTAEGHPGTKIEVDGGKVISVEPCARTPGTTIEVQSLFFNVPARKKFQKSVSVNAAEVTKVVTVLSLSHPEVAFELFHNDTSVFKVVEEPLEKRVEQVLGKEFLSLKVDRDGVHGFVASHEQTRHNRTGQYLFINNRFVTSPLLSYAVRDAFGQRLAPDRHPLYVLYVDVDPERVDVNVHPQKKEVRFREEKEIRGKVQAAVAASLGKPAFTFSEQSFFTHAVPQVQPGLFADFAPQEFSFSAQEDAYALPLLPEEPKYMGVFSRYLLVDENTHLLLVDLPAAASRVAFEGLVHAANKESQGLAVPITLELSPAESQLIEARVSDLEAVGFSLRSFGKSSWIIDAIPACLDAADVAQVIRKIAEDTLEASLPQLIVQFAGVHKKRFLLQEAIALFKELLRSKSPHQCPKGTPTMVQVTHEEISRLFSRSM